jgi:hypothetical protein
VLAVVRRDDPWYDERRTVGQEGDCGSFLKNRSSGQSIVLQGQGEHDVFSDDSVIRKVAEFLRDAVN